MGACLAKKKNNYTITDDEMNFGAYDYLVNKKPEPKKVGENLPQEKNETIPLPALEIHSGEILNRKALDHLQDTSAIASAPAIQTNPMLPTMTSSSHEPKKNQFYPVAAVQSVSGIHNSVSQHTTNSNAEDKLDHVIELLQSMDHKQKRLEDSLTILQRQQLYQKRACDKESDLKDKSGKTQSLSEEVKVEELVKSDKKQTDLVNSRMETQTKEGVTPTKDRVTPTKGKEFQITRDNNHYTSNNNSEVTAGRFRGPEHRVKKFINWPHEFFRGNIDYDNLTPEQFAVGFSRCILLENSKIQYCMLQFYNKIMQVACDLAWPIARSAAALVFFEMEREKLNWSEYDKIEETLNFYTQRAIISNGSGSFKGHGASKQLEFEHGDRLYTHICSYCYDVTNNPYRHLEVECRKSRKAEDECMTE